MTALALSSLHTVSRVAASLLGTYAFVWGFTTLGISLAVKAGMPFDEARTLFYLLAFLVFLTAFCWTFAAASLARVWITLAGGGLLMTAIAWLVVRSLT